MSDNITFNQTPCHLWDRKRKREEELNTGTKSVIPISSLLSEPSLNETSFQFEWFGSTVECSTPLKTVLSCHEEVIDVDTPSRRSSSSAIPFPAPLNSPPRIAIPTPIHPPTAHFPVPCCIPTAPPAPSATPASSSSSSQTSSNSQRGMKPQAIRQLEEQLSRLQKTCPNKSTAKDPKKVKVHYPAGSPTASSLVSPRNVGATKAKDSCCSKPAQPKEVPSCCSKSPAAKDSCCSKKPVPTTQVPSCCSKPPAATKKPSCCSSSDASSGSPTVVLPTTKKSSCCSSQSLPPPPKETSCYSPPKTPVASCCQQRVPQSTPNPPPSPLPYDSSAQKDWGRTDPPEISNTPLSCNCNCSCTSYTKRSCGCACSDSSAGCSCVSTYLLNPNNVLSTLPG